MPRSEIIESNYFYKQWLYHFTLPPTNYEWSFLLILISIWCFYYFLF